MSNSGRDNEFFVGYLSTPPGHCRFLRGCVVTLILLAGIVGIVLAGSQRDPGGAVWNLAEARTLEGIVYGTPCPLIRVIGPSNSVVSILLVDQGKIGAQGRINSHAGRMVRVTGHMLTRSRLMMMELDESADAVREIASPSLPESSRLRLSLAHAGHEVTLRGEIVDPKCFGGAMKPGEGKTHKACAVLCLRGGIPPMFVAAGSGEASNYLLVDSEGKSLADLELERLLPYVGDWIEIHGTTCEAGDIKLLQLAPGGLRRL